MSKRQIIFWLVLLALIGFRGWFLPESKTRTILQAQSLPAVPSQITVPFMASPNTVISSSERNANDTALRDGVNAVRDWLNSAYNNIFALDEDETIAGNNTHTGSNTFTMTVTISGALDLTGTYNQNTLELDSDNTGVENSPLCHSANRGSTSSNNPGICWVTGGIAKIVSDRTSLALDKLQAADGASGNDVTTYQQVPKLTTTNTLTMVNTFDLSPVSNTAASAANELMRRGEVLAADSAITAGGSSEGSGPPVGVCTTGAKYFDIATATTPIAYYCKGADGMTWVKQDVDTITSMLAINGATTLSANLSVSGSRTLDAGSNKWTNVADPTANQDVLTLNYFNNNIGDFVWGNGVDGSATISMNTSLTADKYYTDLTIDPGVILTLNGYVLHVSGTLTWNGTIAAGNGANASGKTAGTNTRGSLPTIDGKTGGSKGTSSNSNITGNAGLNCNVDSAGGDGISASASNAGGTGWKTNLLDVISATILPRSVPFGHYAGSASGDGSIWNGTHGANTGGDGGGSGANGQTAQIIAKNIVFGGASSATGTGGNGANGGNGVCDGDGMAEGGGVGGSAGSGSLFDIVYKTKTGSLFSSTLTGGTKGIGGTGCGGGGNGLDGMDGNSGAVVELDL
ncbi:MAG: hypothetical protein A3F80_01005 [Candidatus Melainabacteria bacterium RIFCSPLOWO2_12_FULL_35_11]|nr:MAG: hypothetical protein A3F80_01005 [Candidatus Melainabacteria bacterium RIFCSPLOWO2_12_FULL_35_11]